LAELLGLSAFDSLQAEYEPWLAQCYVPPPNFALMARWRSMLVFGDAGAGKTALRLALERTWAPPEAKPTALVAHWPFTLVEDASLTGTRLVRAYTAQALDAVARALMHHLTQFPPNWGQLPGWVRNALGWFAQTFFLGDLGQHLEPLQSEYGGEQVSRLQEALLRPALDVLPPSSPIPLVIAEVAKAVQALGLEGVRVTVDGLEPWYEADRTLLADQLESFLNALALFEHPRFAYAIFVPSELDSSDWSPGSVVRRRVDVYRLKWDALALETMMERRLALALGETAFPLSRLGPPERLRRWLRGCGGYSARGWLATLRPFVARFLAKAEEGGRREPLTDEECVRVETESPPRLFIDPDTDQVLVGWRQVEGLQPAQLALLKYLYQQRGRLCPRETVLRYYLQTTGELHRLEPGQARYSAEGLLDQAMYRLRQAIEPDPANPIFVITEKQRGFRLQNAW